MTVRVSPNIVPDTLSGLNGLKQQLNTADLELASGRSINSPSDNPSGIAALIVNHAAQSATDTFERNIGNLQSTLQIADSALNSAVGVINQAISLGVQAGNSSLSAGDRQAIAQQLQGIQQQLVSIANTRSGGTYLFAGTQVETQPFTLNSSSASGVNYSGNSSVTQVEIANGQSVNINVPGDQLFLNPAGSLLGSINQLITAVQTNTGIPAASDALGGRQRIRYPAILLWHGPQPTAIDRHIPFEPEPSAHLPRKQHRRCGHRQSDHYFQPSRGGLYRSARSGRQGPEPAQPDQLPAVATPSR